MRVVVAEDHALLRAGIVELLNAAGFSVVGQCGDAPGVAPLVASLRPDVVLLDIRMPPTNSLEGLVVARALRATYGSSMGILLLSQHVEAVHAAELLTDGAAGIGYLLKNRVLDPASLADAVRRVGQGGSAIDPLIIEHLLGRHRGGPLSTLTPREREVLSVMAEGRSNHSIAVHLCISDKTVEATTSRIFTKLGLEPDPDDHRRVKAVLSYLQSTSGFGE